MFRSCVDCPFSKPCRKENDMVWLKCLYNDRKVGAVEKSGLAEGRGDLTPPDWCPYKDK